ncbi:hypothetical protein BCR36DRAFT_402626 [Piromyces finnis]|uniref:Uncharacterized protein n=1 Tax=Piromyces finnis TaxID=1754191 RepID=A0A1Y1VI65_9FUNG|nr:hypothetical protein BCR36DRAFT_402626 [Piromyces finnis]|eukprot:ORX56654.1 hypothetical protein BCR36DRAFT_402626 [Piromyces finnis]
MLLKKLFSFKGLGLTLFLSSLVKTKPNIHKRYEEDEEDYYYTIGQRTISYLSLYNKNGEILGRRVLTNSLYNNRIMDQIKDYLINNDNIINKIDVVEIIGINHPAFLINYDIFEYGAYPMESLKFNTSSNYEVGPFRWNLNQSAISSTVEWSSQSYLWGVKNHQDSITYSESDFQKALDERAIDFSQIKKLDWKCEYDKEKKRCTNFDIIKDKSYDLLILGLSEITMPDYLIKEYTKFKSEANLYDPQILKKFNVENPNFESTINWFNSTIEELRSLKTICENQDNQSVIHSIVSYECDHLIDSDLIQPDSKFLNGSTYKSSIQGKSMIDALFHILVKMINEDKK